MSATRTFSPFTGGGTGGAIISGTPFTHVHGEQLRQNIDLLAYLIGHLDLGGDETGITVASGGTFQAVRGARAYTLNGDSLGGLTLEAVVFYKTANAGTSVTVRVRNTTDGTTAATGTTSTSTSVVKETLTLTLASGAKDYQLEIAGSNTSNQIVAWGYLRLRKVPA